MNSVKLSVRILDKRFFLHHGSIEVAHIFLQASRDRIVGKIVNQQCHISMFPPLLMTSEGSHGFYLEF